MTRINLSSKTAETRDCVAWGKKLSNKTITEKSGVLFFAALLIICSLAVGCSNDKPKPVTSNNQIPITPSPLLDTMASSNTPAAAQPAKPAVKKVVKKRPSTVTYSDKTYGVSFEYPRRYAIETGDAATELVASSPLPMNFVTPGGTALAAVELPETGFANTDFSSAFFNVSVNKSVSADDCGKFSVPAPAVSAVSDSHSDSSAQSASASTTPAVSTNPTVSANQSTDATPAKTDAAVSTSANNSTPAVSALSQLTLSDMQMQKTEAVTGEGNRQSDSKYVHVYQNGACYEFALNVTTVAAKTDASMKHVDRDKVFNRLEQILSTVKINVVPAPAPEVTASAPATPAVIPDATMSTATPASTPSDSASAIPAAPASPTSNNQ